jgi:hypothetical protein
VRRTEQACPFCGVALALGATPVRMVTERLGRAALFTLGTAVATSGCGARSSLLDPLPAPSSARDAAALPVDAAPGEVDAGAPMTHYGAPPIVVDAFVAEDAGPVVNLYGAPPEPEGDAGVDADLGCCNADYGTPPFW